MRLAEPNWLVLLLLVPLPWFFDRRRPRLSWPTLGGFKARGWRAWARWVRFAAPGALRGLAIGFAVVGLARPQSVAGRTRVATQGVAIVVALDHSSSMKAEDFPKGPNQPPLSRLKAATEALSRFIQGRPDDLIGLVEFANYPDLVAPPTLDHEFLLDIARSIRPAGATDDGTNLGDALVWALDALQEASPPKKVVVLLTDGRNSPAVPEPTDPIEAARIAMGLGVTVHAIAVGREGRASLGTNPATGLPVTTDVDGPDLALLERIAAEGGGKAFEAADADALGEVFRAIDALEKGPVRGEVRTRYREEYVPWAAVALGLVVLDRWRVAGRSRRLP